MKFFKYCYFAAAAVWTALLVHAELFLLPGARSCILERGGVAALSSAGLLIETARSCTTTAMAASFAALALLTVAVAAIGLMKGYIADAYQFLEKNKKEWVAVALITALAVLPYLSKGNVVLGDAMQFSALTMYMKDSIASLSYPFWAFHWYMGAAPLAFYGWLYFLLGGIANLALPIDAANKLLFFALHIASGLLAYRLARILTGNTRMAIIAALIYALSFEHIARVMVGRSITALTYALAPLLFIAFEERLRKSISGTASIALTAITAALLIFNHQADGAFAIAIFLLYAALRTAEAARKSFTTLAAETTAAMMLAFVITSFWAVPMVMESGEASGTTKMLEIITPRMPDLGLAKEMAAWPGKFGDKQMYYVGIPAMALAATGAVYLFRQRKTAIAITAIATVILLLIQSPRHAPAMLLFLGICASYGFSYLSRKFSVNSSKLLAIAVLVIAIDFLPATLQLGYPDYSYNAEFYSSIGAKGGERILDLSTDRRTFWPAYAYISSNAETVFGVLIESAPRSLPYAAAISQMAAAEHYDKMQNFSDKTLDGLYMLGAKYVILHTEQPGKAPEEVFAGKRGALGLERGLEARELEHSVIIAAPQIAKIDYKPQLESMEGWKLREAFERRSIPTEEAETIIDSMGLDRATGRAERIMVKEGRSEVLESEMPAVKVQSVDTLPGKVRISYEASDEAFIQLGYSHSNYLSVKIDGAETGYWKTAINTIAAKTGKGQHTLTIEARQTPLRKRLMIVSAAGALLAVAMLFTGFRQREKFKK